jgi:hypothetical protein
MAAEVPMLNKNRMMVFKNKGKDQEVSDYFASILIAVLVSRITGKPRITMLRGLLVLGTM